MSAAGSEQARILVIAPNWIGDGVMAQPLLRRLRQLYPGTLIDVLAPPWVAPVFAAMSEVAEVLETPFRHGALQLRERWRYAQQLRRRGYSAAYVLPNTLKFALLPWLAGIPRRIGYRGESRYGLINVMHHDDPQQPRPMVPFYAALAEPPQAGQVSSPGRPVLTVNRQQQLQVLQQLGLSDQQPLYCFAPGAEFGNAKRWPAAYFAELAQLILARQPQAQIVLLGSAKDQPVCQEIVQVCPAVRSLAGATTLTQALTLIAGASAMVSNDSGLLHIASALNRPVVAIYGPTDPNHAPPFSDAAISLSKTMDCAPCRQRECPLGHHDCMRGISAGQVAAALDDVQHRFATD